MGLFSNPLGHAGYPPGVTGKPNNLNSTVRAATTAETAAHVLGNVYISPLTLPAALAVDFASPPVLGFGSTIARPVHATTIDASGSITAASGLSSSLGNITAANGNLVSSTLGKGLVLNSPSASGAVASPLLVNGRSGRATFTGVNIPANSDRAFTITNNAIAGPNTQVLYSISGATTGSALSVKSVTYNVGSFVIVLTNAVGALASTANVVINFLVIN